MFVHVERVGLLGKVVGPNGPSSLGSRVRLLTNVFSRAWLVTGRASRQERDGAYSSSVLAFAPAPAPGADPLPSPSPNRSAEPTPARNAPLSSGTSSACRRRLFFTRQLDDVDPPPRLAQPPQLEQLREPVGSGTNISMSVSITLGTRTEETCPRHCHPRRQKRGPTLVPPFLETFLGRVVVDGFVS